MTEPIKKPCIMCKYPLVKYPCKQCGFKNLGNEEYPYGLDAKKNGILAFLNITKKNGDVIK